MLLTSGSLVTLFVALVAASLGVALIREVVSGFVGNDVTSYVVSIAVSTAGVFFFLLTSYYALTNDEIELRDVVPGAVLATIVLQATFQTLPLYVRFASLNPTLATFGATAILLVWLYVMANVIVLGAEVNWWYACGRRDQLEVEEAAGLA